MRQGSSGEHGVCKHGRHMIECMQVCVILVVAYSIYALGLGSSVLGGCDLQLRGNPK
jgi:hypothetical protein